MYVMKLLPIPRPALWGHTKLKDYFHYDSYPDGIGQSWSFSMQEFNSNTIMNGHFKGETFKDIWNNHPEFFESKHDHFPFIIGLVGPEDSLSIQVHPDTEYAKRHGLPSGKNEAWYFIDADEDADLIYGHNATDLNDMKKYIEENRWEDLIRRIKVKPKDFVYVPATLLHAMQKGVIAYEVQEATDVTYRLYDFDRIGADGKKRTLDITESLDCISYDKSLMENKIQPLIIETDDYKETCFINNESFKIMKLEVNDHAQYSLKNYLLITVVKGQCMIDDVNLQMGESVFVPKGMPFIEIHGNVELMITTEGEKE